MPSVFPEPSPSESSGYYTESLEEGLYYNTTKNTEDAFLAKYARMEKQGNLEKSYPQFSSSTYQQYVTWQRGLFSLQNCHLG